MCLRRICVIKAGEKRGNKVYNDNVLVPCGRCPDCKKRRVDEWVFRLMEQDKISSCSQFITLTYDTRYVPITQNGFMTLDHKDVQKFFKRLRKETNEEIKYYLAGEYGSITQRPHYHIIMFGNITTDNIADNWKLGAIHVGQVSGDSIAYTCKYLDKESKVPTHARDDRKKEYSVSSKGLGLNYITDKTIKWHTEDLERNYIVKEGGMKIALPRIYRDKILSEKQKEESRRLATQSALQQEAEERQEHGEEYERVKAQEHIFKYNKLHKSSKKVRDV